MVLAKKNPAQQVPTKAVKVDLRSDFFQALEPLKGEYEPEDHLILRIAEEAVAVDLVSKAGTGTPPALTLEDCASACGMIKKVLGLGGFDMNFAATVVRAVFNDHSDADVSHAFEVFPKTETGFIATSEIKRLLPALGVDLPMLKLHAFLKGCGIDRLSEIEYREFVHLIREVAHHNHASSSAHHSSYLPSLGIGSAVHSLGSGLSHVRDAYSAGLHNHLSTFELRKAGVIMENFEAAGHSKEAATTVTRAVLGEHNEANMKDAFKFFDKDESGKLNFDELKKALPLMGEDVDPAMVEEICAEADKNKSGTVDFAEFSQLVKAMNPRDPPPPAADAEEEQVEAADAGAEQRHGEHHEHHREHHGEHHGQHHGQHHGHHESRTIDMGADPTASMSV